MQEIDYTSKTFSTSHSELCQRSIQIALDGFSLCIFNNQKNRIVRFVYTPIQCRRSNLIAPKFMEWLHTKGQTDFIPHIDRFILKTSCFVPTPTELIHSKNIERYYTFSHTKENDSDILRTDHSEYGLTTLFECPTNLKEKISLYFPEVQIEHSNKLLLDTLALNTNHNRYNTSILCNMYRGGFDLIVFSKKELIFINHFATQSENDFIYYTLVTCKQLDIDTVNTELIFSGIISYLSPEAHMMRNYIKKITFAKLDNRYYYPAIISKTPEHYFHLILNSFNV